MLAADRSGEDVDRRTAQRLLKALTTGYPSSSLVRQAKQALQDLNHDSGPAVAEPAPTPPRLILRPPRRPRHRRFPITAEAKPAATSGEAFLSEIHRTTLPDGVRITIDLGSEVAYHQEEVGQPRRVFFDLKNVRSASSLQDATLKYDDDVVKEIRLGRHPQNTVRVVLNLEGVASYSVYSLYNPVPAGRRRDAHAGSQAAAAVPLVASLPAPQPTRNEGPAARPDVKPPAAVPTSGPAPRRRSARERPTRRRPRLPCPCGARRRRPSRRRAAPAANSNGKFSMSRQLGLSVSRIVIDAGHGGHDPGAQGSGLNEAELTLDVALRLQKLLEKQGVEVVMTRDTDVFIPLQERTAIANRENADMFLSIHANASRNPEARGVETYFLNFANNREAEAVAARENAGSGRTMHNLPDIVKAIALNNKLNESRDLAESVQRSMVQRLGTRSKQLRDLGVKQAPFVVLIGAGMPSVLAEISFITHKQEGALLKSGAYRQQIAQALLDGVLGYQQSLKKMNAVAGKRATF